MKDRVNLSEEDKKELIEKSSESIRLHVMHPDVSDDEPDLEFFIEELIDEVLRRVNNK